ncbi:hypothetical protein J3R30DRAFT_1410683 [Lentinula aciculospora]|uniref:Uncharacterized protein n=1 Tax=Lentinula aciculospora TaxID=153920 RepID=A0A9W9AMC9_9AGAR|nr:hypothetical protein J3R30DRAFT_1410683 [Lentinula aciculospora]
MDPACRISDSDISGIGVRSSFYLQSFLLVILVDRSTDASTSLWTFTAASFGLTIAAVIQYAKQQLSLLEALQVSNLVWLANFGIFVALASYSRHKRNTRRKHGGKTKHRTSESSRPDRGHESDYGVKTASMVQTLLSMALTLFMWSTPETFQPSQCLNTLSYVLFVWKIPIRHSGRIIGLTFSAILTCIYITVTLREYWISYRKRKLKSKKKRKELTPPSPFTFTRREHTRARPNSSLSVQTSVYKYGSQTTSLSLSVRTPSKSNRPHRKLWSNIDPMFIGILIFETIVFLYLIVSNEILLRENHADTGKFGFGQILALVVVLPVLLSVIGAFRENGFRPRSRTGTKKVPTFAK